MAIVVIARIATRKCRYGCLGHGSGPDTAFRGLGEGVATLVGASILAISMRKGMGTMFEGFDDFSREHDQEKGEHERVTTEAGSQWKLLMSLASRFAGEGKAFDGHSFSWSEGLHSLILGAVAARFNKGGSIPNAPGRGYSVTLCRAPRSGEFLDEPPIRDETLSLELQFKDEAFAWSVINCESSLSPEVLIVEIARRLSKYHLEYEKASGS